MDDTGCRSAHGLIGLPLAVVAVVCTSVSPDRRQERALAHDREPVDPEDVRDVLDKTAGALHRAEQSSRRASLRGADAIGAQLFAGAFRVSFVVKVLPPITVVTRKGSCLMRLSALRFTLASV